jgi:hypothetical protein
MNLARAFCVLLAFMNLYGHVKAQTEAPQPAPGLYVTSNYGLMAKIPKGLTYCPLPEGWEGSDHGTVLFLEPPAGCIPSSAYASSSRPTTNFAPAISLFYEHNSAEVNRTEYVRESCDKPRLKIPPGLMLLGKPALGCRHDDGDRVEIALAALYWSRGEGVIVTLLTTRKRLSRDLPFLAKVASAISECKPDWDKSKRVVRACPDAPWW